MRNDMAHTIHSPLLGMCIITGPLHLSQSSSTVFVVALRGCHRQWIHSLFGRNEHNSGIINYAKITGRQPLVHVQSIITSTIGRLTPIRHIRRLTSIRNTGHHIHIYTPFSSNLIIDSHPTTHQSYSLSSTTTTTLSNPYCRISF